MIREYVVGHYTYNDTVKGIAVERSQDRDCLPPTMLVCTVTVYAHNKREAVKLFKQFARCS